MIRKIVDVIAVLCTLFARAVMLLATGPLRGWVMLASCAVVGVLLLRHRMAPDRRATMLLGVHVLPTGLSVGLPTV